MDEEGRGSCGEEGWEGVYRIRELLAEARKKHLPTFYTTAEENRSNTITFGGCQAKGRRTTEDMTEAWEKANEIVAEIAPQQGDIIVHKQKPSAFSGTPLMSMLIQVHADSLLVTGTTTKRLRARERPRLIDVARRHRSPQIRRDAFFWLGQSGDPRALVFIEEILSTELSSAPSSSTKVRM